MKKFAILLAATAVLFVAAAPLTNAVAKDKKLWEGWMEDVKKVHSDISGKMAAKKK
jgi:hypothetical protein